MPPQLRQTGVPGFRLRHPEQGVEQPEQGEHRGRVESVSRGNLQEAVEDRHRHGTQDEAQTHACLDAPEELRQGLDWDLA